MYVSFTQFFCFDESTIKIINVWRWCLMVFFLSFFRTPSIIDSTSNISWMLMLHAVFVECFCQLECSFYIHTMFQRQWFLVLCFIFIQFALEFSAFVSISPHSNTKIRWLNGAKAEKEEIFISSKWIGWGSLKTFRWKLSKTIYLNLVNSSVIICIKIDNI